MKLILPHLAAALLLMTGAAQAETRCTVPMIDWQPRDAVARLAAQNGWTVRRIKIDDGCYELIGTDANGRRVEVKLHPGTLAVVTREYNESDAHEDNEDQHED